MTELDKQTLLIIGAGNMGCSIAKGLLAKQWHSNQITFCEQQSSRHDQLSTEFPESTIITDIDALNHSVTVVLLAVKPNDMHNVCKQLASKKLQKK